MNADANAGWHYYKGYYQGAKFPYPQTKGNREVNISHWKDRNRELTTDLKLPKWTDPLEGIGQTFELVTAYPGLLVGSGYIHETKLEGELKLGLSFDHTLGLPVIPGSSVKGLLRSAFQQPEYIHALLTEFSDFEPDEDFELEWLENRIFEGLDILGDKAPPHEQDVFHDALPIGPVNAPYLAEGTITPHHPDDPDGQLRNPVPIAFLKVRPGITFRFRFELQPAELLGITAEHKLALFKQILLDLGAGAKTRVGFGQWDPTS